MTENYRIGQTLYIIPSDTASVVPVQIMERRICETASGVAVKHIVRMPKPKAQPMILETIKGTVYSDLRVVRESMIRNATAAIENMVKHAHNVAQQAFGPPAMAARIPDSFDGALGSTDVGAFDDLDMSSDLVDGGMTIPPSLPEPEPSLSPQPPPRHPVPSAFMPDSNIDGTAEVMLPNGQKQRVRIKAS